MYIEIKSGLSNKDVETLKKDFTELIKNEKYDELSLRLSQISYNDLGKNRMWELREFYFFVPDEIAVQNNALCAAKAVLYDLSANTELSEKYVEMLIEKRTGFSSRSKEYKEISMYLAYLDVALPQKKGKSPLHLVRSISALGSGGKNKFPQLSITANRPSIINGGRDFTEYGKFISKILPSLRGMAYKLYGDRGTGMPEIAAAEMLYQKNKVYEALVQLVSITPFIEQKGDVNVLFAAMSLQTWIMVVNNQLPVIQPMINNIRQKIYDAKADYLIPNLNALNAWTALYDGDHNYINNWMNKEAPDEFGDFCTLDRFRYFVKLRIYIMQDKHLSAVGLSERLKPTLITFGRKMEMCELSILMAISHYAQGEKEKAFELVSDALVLAKKYRYDRLIGNEGGRLYIILREYRNEKGETPYLNRVIELTRRLSLIYPDYLKQRREELPPLTKTEIEILQLMAADRTNAEIAEFMEISVNTVKFHSKNIFSKLDATNRRQAVSIACEFGIIQGRKMHAEF